MKALLSSSYCCTTEKGGKKENVLYRDHRINVPECYGMLHFIHQEALICGIRQNGGRLLIQGIYDYLVSLRLVEG